ncbi:hypothetical protein NFI96_024459 [Prochilodus magdalenae]|nr:hypothetical protein NFI96_024459 [Prochilodus magdalenae]
METPSPAVGRPGCVFLLSDEYKMKGVEKVKYAHGEEEQMNTRNQENMEKSTFLHKGKHKDVGGNTNKISIHSSESQQEFFRMLDEKIEKSSLTSVLYEEMGLQSAFEDHERLRCSDAQWEFIPPSGSQDREESGRLSSMSPQGWWFEMSWSGLLLRRGGRHIARFGSARPSGEPVLPWSSSLCSFPRLPVPTEQEKTPRARFNPGFSPVYIFTTAGLPG